MFEDNLSIVLHSFYIDVVTVILKVQGITLLHFLKPYLLPL